MERDYRNGERRIGGWRKVPVKLCPEAGPLHNGVLADRILERRDDDLGAGRARSRNCLIHVGDFDRLCVRSQTEMGSASGTRRSKAFGRDAGRSETVCCSARAGRW